MGRLILVTQAALLLALATTHSLAEEVPAAPAQGEGKDASPVDRPLVDDTPLPAEDVRAIQKLLGRFAAAMTAGDADGVGELLSPALSPEEREQIVSRARREFRRTLYRRFAFELEGSPVVDRLGADRIEILTVATYEYESRASGGGGQSQIAGAAETSYPFRLAKSGGEWRIVWSELIEQFATKSMEQFLGWMFLVVFLAAVAVFFWGWMTTDAYVRSGRLGVPIVVLLTPPVGAVIYFFAVYLRRSFVRREQG